MKIESISVEYNSAKRIIVVKIKFPNGNDLDEFTKIKSLQGLSAFSRSFSLNNHTLRFGANEQFYYELSELLNRIKDINDIDSNICQSAIRQFELAQQELLAKPIRSLSEICKGWRITSDLYDTTAINPVENAQLVSIKLTERLLRIPDMSWSEYCDFERAEYGKYCEMKFSSKELAEAHCDKFKVQGDVKLIDSSTVLHGPRSCLDAFKRELMSHLNNECIPTDKAELASKFYGAESPTMFKQSTKVTHDQVSTHQEDIYKNIKNFFLQ